MRERFKALIPPFPIQPALVCLVLPPYRGHFYSPICEHGDL